MECLPCAATVPRAPEIPVLYLTSSYSVHLMGRRPHDNGARVTAYDVQCRRIRKRKLTKAERRQAVADALRREAEAVGAGKAAAAAAAVGGAGDDEAADYDSDSNLLGPSQAEADTDKWKRDEWYDVGRYDRAVANTPPVACLQYQFPVPFPDGTPEWGVMSVPDHARSDKCVAAMWHGHPAVGDHMGTTGYVSAADKDPRVGYFAAQNILPRSLAQFRIRAVNSVGPSEWSDVSVSVKTTRTAPLPPGSVRLKGQADNLLSVYWAPARPNGYPVTRYHLEVKLYSPLDPTVIPSTRNPLPQTQWAVVRDDLTETYCLVPGLKYGCGYTFRVKALNKVGWSLWSDESEVIKTSRLMT